MRHPKGTDPLGGLPIRKMLATGRLQSAFRLVTYINAVHPRTHLFDGYLVHSRGANASGFKAEGLARDAENAVPPSAVRNFCFLFGRTKLFDAANVTSLHPTHDAFVKQYSAAVDALMKQGYLLKPEAEIVRKTAAQSSIGSQR